MYGVKRTFRNKRFYVLILILCNCRIKFCHNIYNQAMSSCGGQVYSLSSRIRPFVVKQSYRLDK